ncbi:MAG: spermidine synthase [Acidobacteria bacterium]|nr:MAG: spermidine synthase [Acidobacteriota bacterium]
MGIRDRARELHVGPRDRQRSVAATSASRATAAATLRRPRDHDRHLRTAPRPRTSASSGRARAAVPTSDRFAASQRWAAHLRVRSASQHDRDFGRVLGLLYGSNTIGAVVGALAGELFLIRALGVRGAGVVAACCSLIAGLAALSLHVAPTLSRREPAGEPAPRRLLFAAGLSGFALLALEVIWFRFVIFFVASTSVAFAVMLAVVLAGIGIGALIASAIWTRFPNADRATPVVACASAVALVLSYSGFVAEPARYETTSVFIDSLRLMLPVSILSGVFFTVIGRAVERELGEESRAAAFVTFANTIGAAIGPIIAGFVLIPTIGVEGSFFTIGVLYVVIALLAMRNRISLIPIAIAAVTLVFFPFHLWRNYFLPNATHEYRDSRIVAVREGPIETAVYLRTDIAGEPYVYKLFTNGFSMSGTAFPSKRYMSAFVYLPLALRPQTKNALLISYGVGVTAKRLTEAKQLESIDIVDISKSIVDLSSIVWPGASYPPADRRVRTHIEDGRFFLLTTAKRFDLITAEPPPPKTAGIVNLYTREYFELMRDRLSDHGIASYWLPIYQLSDSDAKAIIGAFCGAFSDCSLWSGAGAEWILVGSRGNVPAPTYEAFSRQWRDPVSAATLKRIGIETPEQLAATFVADAPILRRVIGGSPALTDNHPLRLDPNLARGFAQPIFPLMLGAPDAFVKSDFIRRALPPQVVAAAPASFGPQQLLDRTMLVLLGLPSPRSPEVLRRVLTTTKLRTLPRLLLGTDPWLEDIAIRERTRGNRHPFLAYVVAVGALADRDYGRARDLFAEARRGLPRSRELPGYEALAESLAR